jgi:hypothetical protein
MRIGGTWNNRLVGSLFISISAIVTMVLFKLPFYHGYFFGDDSLLVNDATNPNGPHGLISETFIVGGGKWRPLITPLLLRMARYFGNNLVPFQIVSMVLLMSTAVLIGLMVHRLTGKTTPAVFATSLFLSSPFTWLYQSWTYGVMESAALLGTVISLFILTGFFIETKHAQLRIWVAFSFLHISTLIHERYIVVSLALFITYLIFPKYAHRREINFSIFLLIPLFHVVVKGFLLDLNPITSGGESSGDSSLGFEFVYRLLRGMQGVLGGLSGSGYFYSTSRFAIESNSNAATAVIPITVVLLIVLAVLFGIATKNRYVNDPPSEQSTQSVLSAALIGIVGLSLLVPGALVEERFEGRWILGPQIFIISAVLITAFNFLKISFIKYFISLSLTMILLSVNWSYKSYSSEYFVYRNQTDKALTMLGELVPKRGAWSLVIRSTDPSSPTNWQFAYGYALQQLTNPPYSLDEACPRYRLDIPCFILELIETDQIRILQAT